MNQIMLVSELIDQIQYLFKALIFGFTSHLFCLEVQPIQETLHNFLGGGEVFGEFSIS
jgi:hypothetical protein